MSLKMWQCEIDIVIAETIEDAIYYVACLFGPAENLGEALQVICDEYGSNYEDYEEENWKEWKPEELFKLNPGDGGPKLEKPVSEWIKEKGAGYFACTEF